MAPRQSDIQMQALQLPERDRADLAKALLLSLGEDEEVDDAVWVEEAGHRFEELRQGLVEGLTTEAVFREARLNLK